MPSNAHPWQEWFRAVPDVVLVLEPSSLRIADVNRQGGEVFGYYRDELLGLTLRELCPGIREPALASAVRDATTTSRRRSVVETTCRQRDGEDRPIDLVLAG